MDPLFHTRDERTVNTMDFTGWTSSEESEDREVGRKGDGHSFFRCTRYNSYRLPFVVANDHRRWQLLRSLIGPFQQHFKERTSPFSEEKSVLPSRQCTGLHVPGSDGQIQRIPLRIASLFSIFARFSALQLFPVSKPEEMIWRKERLILKDWTNHIIRMATWKSWRIAGSSVSNWKETMLRNKNESIKKNVFFMFF